MTKLTSLILALGIAALALPSSLAFHERDPPLESCQRGMARNAMTETERDALVEVDSARIPANAGGRIYIDIDTELMPEPYLLSYHTYQESNGIPGLQRGDEVVDQTCGGHLGESDLFCFC